MTTELMISKHIASVQIKLERLVLEIIKRSKEHDSSKLIEPEISLWKKMDEEPRCPYGTKEYFEKINRNKLVFDLHYKNNPHHPEHFLNGINDMDLVDVLELLCDWISYKEIISYSEAVKIVKQQAKRFNLSEQLTFIMINTLTNYFIDLGQPENVTPDYIKQIQKNIIGLKN